jgi:hypothetical protein
MGSRFLFYPKGRQRPEDAAMPDTTSPTLSPFYRDLIIRAEAIVLLQAAGCDAIRLMLPHVLGKLAFINDHVVAIDSAGKERLTLHGLPVKPVTVIKELMAAFPQAFGK